ncbi:aspartate aminotransferase family protein [Parageobacillus sp. G301]|uniref:aspartate aminotransferase family protein n=1 Tax=Parageobacillus sp. G301 TaxID=2998290 RepID=UPI0024998DF0|nr:aspartate aminotransferase family protein [Parageobacillus sp. G301]GLH65442.1 glutamate-1-semialdehyde 2,1-aminomutase [Parageobacillus sp. G301]
MVEIEQTEAVASSMKRSFHLYEKAKEVIPGGVTANIKYFAPHPIIMERGKGSRLVDVDGNEYVDYLLCYGALILGHGHPKVIESIMRQIITDGTTVFGAPHMFETLMAKKIIQAFPSMEMVRYTNSGLEATLLAIRLAQAFTGKTAIAKFEGHYHGGYDQVLISVNPSVTEAGDEKEPNAVPESKGIPPQYTDETIILPFNDIEATEAILRKHKNRLAAVILEPVQGGFIPADAIFMKELRAITKELGIVLIFDEVKTGFRITYGGAQTVYGIAPDLTALGKVLGGGFPIGVIGGKKEIMEQMDPRRGKDALSIETDKANKGDVLFHSGTYNGHPTVLAAGLATLDVLQQPETMPRLLQMTNMLREGLEAVYRAYGIPMKTVGLGSIFNIVLTEQDVKNYRDLTKANMKLREEIDYELLGHGVYTKPGNRYSMSVVHTEEDIAWTIEAHEKAIRKVKNRL